MNAKQLRILLVLGAIFVAASVYLMKAQDASWQASELQLGAPLFKGLDINKIAALRMRNAKDTLELHRVSDQWRVTQRGDYPAGVDAIRDFLLRLRDLKVVQTETVPEAQRARLDLVEPGKGEHPGTRIEFFDAAGQRLASALVGKKHQHGEQAGGEDGRYVLVGETDTVAVVTDPLNVVDLRPERWLDRTFFRAERARSIARVDSDPANAWKIERDSESAPWRLVDADPAKKIDDAKVNAIANAVGALAPQDVVPSADPAKTGLDKPVTVMVETFDGLTYTFKLGNQVNTEASAKIGEQAGYFQGAVSGEPKRERNAPKDEKPADRERAEKEFKEELARFTAHVARERTLDKWVYLVGLYTSNTLSVDRSKLYLEPKPSPTPNPAGGPTPVPIIDLK